MTPINSYDECYEFLEHIVKQLDYMESFGVFDYRLERSRGMGSYETFYIELEYGEKDEYDCFVEYSKIRVSNHYNASSHADCYIWIDGYTKKQLEDVILAKVQELTGWSE